VRKEFLRYSVIVVVLMGGLAAMAAPNLYRAMQYSKQKRTYATLRDWGTAIDDYRSKHGTYPSAGYYGPVAGLTPLITRKLPIVDGWGHPLLYHGTKNHYALRSTARDGVNDHRAEPGVTRHFDDDALYADGGFVRVMEGICGDGNTVDDWDVKKYGECASCHPAHVRHS
jgi:type II secretory pathway pseudopilin PulG